MSNNVTVYLEVYNEAHRLKECLQNFQWADELVVFVKASDDSTLSIASQYATHVYEVEYSPASENFETNVRKHAGKEWSLFITASSLIDPELVDRIEVLTSDPLNQYEVIGLPYSMYVFGLTGSSSPWGAKHKLGLIRRSAMVLTTTLHREIGWKDGSEIYLINDTDGRFYHCTHSNPEDFFLRHMRYVKYEAADFIETFGVRAYRVAFVDLLRSLGSVFVKRRSIYKGRNGLSLSLAYVSYFLMRLIFIWHKQRDVDDPYIRIRADAVAKWNSRQISKSG
ncbi:hypothetical protein N9P94_00175 [Pseudomonadales bacterium]|nr:hypothetical protein [Pseudomonadales bacterium]